METRSLSDLKAHLEDVNERSRKIDAEFNGREFTPEAREESDALKEEKTRTEAAIAERQEREAYIDGLSNDSNNTETEGQQSARFSFQTNRPGRRVPDDPTNLEEYRARAT